MLNKKGFTLIELLGTLVLLSIIFVITVPRINDFIKTSREEAHNDSVSAIEKAISLYATSQDLINEGTMPLTVTIRDGKYFYNFYGNAEQEGNILEIKGKVPDKGKITIQADKSYEYQIYSKALNICTKNDNTNYLKNIKEDLKITAKSNSNSESILVGDLELPDDIEVGDIILFEYTVEYSDAIYDIEQEDAGMYLKVSDTFTSEKMKLNGTGVYQVSNVYKVTENDISIGSYNVSFEADYYKKGKLKISNPKIIRQNAQIDLEGECE